MPEVVETEKKQVVKRGPSVFPGQEVFADISASTQGASPLKSWGMSCESSGSQRPFGPKNCVFFGSQFASLHYNSKDVDAENLDRSKA